MIAIADAQSTTVNSLINGTDNSLQVKHPLFTPVPPLLRLDNIAPETLTEDPHNHQYLHQHEGALATLFRRLLATPVAQAHTNSSSEPESATTQTQSSC